MAWDNAIPLFVDGTTDSSNAVLDELEKIRLNWKHITDNQSYVHSSVHVCSGDHTIMGSKTTIAGMSVSTPAAGYYVAYGKVVLGLDVTTSSGADYGDRFDIGVVVDVTETTLQRVRLAPGWSSYGEGAANYVRSWSWVYPCGLLAMGVTIGAQIQGHDTPGGVVKEAVSRLVVVYQGWEP